MLFLCANVEKMTRLHHIILALGSNIQQEAIMREARKLLSALFPDIEFTHVMWTEPIGMEGSLSRIAWLMPLRAWMCKKWNGN